MLGDILPASVRRPLDLGAYWAILLVIQFPAIYLAGAAAMGGALARKGAAAAEKRLVVGFALLAGASLVVPWLFASTIANNDLAWRGVLPAVLVLTIFAAAGLSRWLATAPRLAAAAIACWAIGVPGGLRIAAENAVGVPAASAAILAQTPELWAAVRRHTAPGRARRQQSAVPCRQRALAGQHLLGALCRSALLLCRLEPGARLCAVAGPRDRPDQCACSSGSLPAPARRRTFATSPPATIVG